MEDRREHGSTNAMGTDAVLLSVAPSTCSALQVTVDRRIQRLIERDRRSIALGVVLLRFTQYGIDATELSDDELAAKICVVEQSTSAHFFPEGDEE